MIPSPLLSSPVPPLLFHAFLTNVTTVTAAEIAKARAIFLVPGAYSLAAMHDIPTIGMMLKLDSRVEAEMNLTSGETPWPGS